MPYMNKLSNYKTTIGHDNGFTVITYHTTPIVKFNDEKIILNTGGWSTVTTARKMRQAATQFGLEYSLYIKHGVWTVEYAGETYSFGGNVLELQRRLAREVA